MGFFKLLRSGRLLGTAILLLATAGTAVAAPCIGAAHIGLASTDDVTLAGFDPDRCVISNVNPQDGLNGNTSGFDSVFGGGWKLVTKIDQHGKFSVNPSTVDDVSYKIDYTQNASKTSGTWGLTTRVDAMFDLVFAMHASNRSGAFLFENEPTAANVTRTGNWRIEWLNDAGNVPNYSNLTLFVRDYRLEAPGSGGAPPSGGGAPPSGLQTVPEPATCLLILGGLIAVRVARSGGNDTCSRAAHDSLRQPSDLSLPAPAYQ